MFAVTDPDGRQELYVHRLGPDETYNNSFAAVSPDGQWLVSGEWGQVNHLLVFPTPVLNPAAPGPADDLPLHGRIRLHPPARNVQGAVFLDETTLVCSSEDPTSELWPTPRQLLEVKLETSPNDGDVKSSVTYLGGLPAGRQSVGSPEVEGIDYDRRTGDLRVVIVPGWACGLLVRVVRFRRQPSAGVAG
jgi:hypothetical protein